jgi:hypothetical protein
MRWLTIVVLIGCGSAAPPVETPPPATQADAPAPLFASHGPITLRSSDTTRPPFVAELMADGTVTGTRCGATRLTDDGSLERDGTVVARVIEHGDALTVLAGDHDTAWRIEADVLTAGGVTRFTRSTSTITSSDPQLPSIAIDPPTAPSRLALGFFASLLVCDDAAP